MDIIGTIRRTIRESNEEGVRFLLIDLDVAQTFIDLAHDTHDPEAARRNQKNARTAYDAIARLLPKLNPSMEETQIITDRMAALRLSLESLGEIF